jgi:hypothetical protein
MTHKDNEFQTWKTGQISYFQNYLRHFKKNSEEYMVLVQGIEELRKGI